jgi:hypothetical protein
MPVPGLAASDFMLLDNGVPQVVTEVSVEDVPIDVTLIVDVSDSTRQVLERIRQDTNRILELLRPVDRVRVLAIDSYVYEVVDWRPASGVTLPPQAVGGGMSSIYDAMVVGLMGRSEPNRRRLVVVLTDAVDTMSVVSATAVLAIARQSDSVLHVVLTDAAYSGAAASARSDSLFATPVELSHPGQREIAMLEEAALATGGQLHRPGRSKKNVVAAFRAIFDAFRHSYLLRFIPMGVSPAGWHAVEVSVKGLRSFRVRAPISVVARKGYFAS